MKFSNVGILWKILTLVCVMSAVNIGGVVYSTGGMRFIDNRYGDLLDGFGKGNLAMARAKELGSGPRKPGPQRGDWGGS